MRFNPFTRRFATPPPNPRKVETGTSYSSKGQGALPPPPELNMEEGSSTPVIMREVVPELISPFQRQQVYARMMQDAGVDMSMRAWKTPVLGSDFYVEAYSDSVEDAEIAEFIEGNLFEGMSAPFLNSLEDVLHFCEDGFAVLYKVFEQREWSPKRAGSNKKQYTMLKKLGVRPPSTIKDIVYDENGGPKELVQTAIQPDGTTKDVTMTIDKLLIFTLNRYGGDIRGKSLLRTAYPHWYYKTHLFKIDAVQKERHALGILKGRLMAGADNNDKEYLRQMLRNMRTNEEQFMILTQTVDVEIEWPSGHPVDIIGSAAFHNNMILLNVMAQFLALGLEGTAGSRAAGATQSDIFLKALKYVANHIADEINMYLVPELVVYNFNTTNFPKLRVRNIGETRDLQMLGSALANLFAQGALTGDPATENWIRTTFDMPKKTAEAQAAQAQQATNGVIPSTVAPFEQQAPKNGNQSQTGNVKAGGGGNAPKPSTSPT